MSTISKSELAASVAANLGSTKESAAKAVTAVVGEIAAALANGNKVILSGLGVFDVKATKARIGRNPATGESVDIPAGRKFVFKPASDLKRNI